MSYGVDIIVVGGGPGGTAAAIWGALCGLRVKLFESSAFPRHRPGETLHPGLEAIFKQLGVLEQIEAEVDVRHEAIAFLGGSDAVIKEFGTDDRGKWKGYQIVRERLDCILLERARSLGVEILQPELAIRPLIGIQRIEGVVDEREEPAKFVIDASGQRAWLRRHLSLPLHVASIRLLAKYGYCEGHLSQNLAVPMLINENTGWLWLAQVGPQLYNWTRLLIASSESSYEVPLQFSELRSVGRSKGADVTWRMVEDCAGAGYFIVGDAAAILDPSSSNGVLKALMTGISAADWIACISRGVVSEERAGAAYRRWLKNWFLHDVERLARFYGDRLNT